MVLNYRQLKYAVQLSEIRSFSQLAEQNKISQPALSKIIKSLEDEIGVKLFNRNTNPLSVTTAGEFFIREAKIIVFREEQLLKGLEKFKSGEAGKLVIGISPFRSQYMVSDALKKVKERFPNICPVLCELNSDELRKETSEGKFDFSIINLPVDESIFDIIPMEPDMLVLAIPNNLFEGAFDERLQAQLKCLRKYDKDTEMPSINFAECKNIPFVVMGQTQEMRILFDKLCAKAEFSPNISAEVVGMATARNMVYEGIGAALLPFQFVEKDYKNHGVKLFCVEDKTNLRQPAIVTRRGQYVSEAAKYAIELLSRK